MAPLRSPSVRLGIFALGIFGFFAGMFFVLPFVFATTAINVFGEASSTPPPTLDRATYDGRMLALAHINPDDLLSRVVSSTTASTTETFPPLLTATSTASTSVSIVGERWPSSAPYPEYGALLPFNRIVAYYGNFYSTQMGVLGEYPPSEMLAKLASTTEEWQAADPNTPVIPAIDYIVETAQAAAGKDGKYRARMPDDQIDKALALAKAAGDGIVVLDFQVGKSTLEQELPLYEKYLAMPNVHLAVDPEFSIKDNSRPGLEIGTMDQDDINYAAEYLASLVDQYHLPPKILVIHRFTKAMLTGYEDIQPLPEVQIVMDMDGFGPQWEKIDTFNYIIAAEPVQFTGFKLFYKNDIPPRGDKMLTPEQILSLTPSPVFIQYQ